VGLISKLLSLLGVIWSSKFLPVYLLYKMLKKLNLLYPLMYLFWCVIIVLPSMLGTYAYLSSNDISQVVSFVSTIGITFGGQGIEVWNAFWSIEGALQEGRLGLAFLIFIGAATSILRFFGFFYIFHWISDKWESTVSDSYKTGLGLVILGLCTIIAWVVDIYALPGTSQLSGYTYVLSNPEIVVDPLTQWMGQAPSESVEALNNSVNNSTVGG